MNDRESRQLAAQWAHGIREGRGKDQPIAEPSAVTPSEPPRKRSLALLNDGSATQLDALGFEVRRPKTRADCLEMERPCPFVSCRHHLYIDVSKDGGLTMAVPELELWEMIDTCSLDVAEEGSVPGTGEGDGLTLESVALIYGLSRERIRQVETVGLHKLEKKLRTALPEYVAEYGQKRTLRVVVEKEEDGEGDEDDRDP